MTGERAADETPPLRPQGRPDRKRMTTMLFAKRTESIDDATLAELTDVSFSQSRQIANQSQARVLRELWREALRSVGRGQRKRSPGEGDGPAS